MSQATTSPTQVDLRNPGRPINVGIILLGGTTEILDIAPIDLLHGMTPESLAAFPPGLIPDDLKNQAVEFNFYYINETGKPAQLTSGMTVNVTHTFKSSPPLDITLLGATIHPSPYTPTPAELHYLRQTYSSPTLHSFLTICAGMLPALQAGLLSGKRATAPRLMLPMLREQAPDVEWTERRWEVDESETETETETGKGKGKKKVQVWTSGTLLNGCDMVREWAGRTWGGAKGEKERSLMGVLLEVGGWPIRSRDFEDGMFGKELNGGGNGVRGAGEVKV